MNDVVINQLVAYSLQPDSTNNANAVIMLSSLSEDFSSIDLLIQVLNSNNTTCTETIIYCITTLIKLIKKIFKQQKQQLQQQYADSIIQYYLNNFTYIQNHCELHSFSADLLLTIFQFFPEFGIQMLQSIPQNFQNSNFSLYLLARFVHMTNKFEDYAEIFNMILEKDIQLSTLLVLIQEDTLSSPLALIIYQKIGLKTLFSYCSDLNFDSHIVGFVKKIQKSLRTSELPMFIEDCLNNLFTTDFKSSINVSLLLAQTSISKMMKFSELWCLWVLFNLHHLIDGFVKNDLAKIENCLSFFRIPFNCLIDNEDASFFAKKNIRIILELIITSVSHKEINPNTLEESLFDSFKTIPFIKNPNFSSITKTHLAPLYQEYTTNSYDEDLILYSLIGSFLIKDYDYSANQLLSCLNEDNMSDIVFTASFMIRSHWFDLEIQPYINTDFSFLESFSSLPFTLGTPLFLKSFLRHYHRSSPVFQSLWTPNVYQFFSKIAISIFRFLGQEISNPNDSFGILKVSIKALSFRSFPQIVIDQITKECIEQIQNINFPFIQHYGIQDLIEPFSKIFIYVLSRKTEIIPAFFEKVKEYFSISPKFSLSFFCSLLKSLYSHDSNLKLKNYAQQLYNIYSTNFHEKFLGLASLFPSKVALVLMTLTDIICNSSNYSLLKFESFSQPAMIFFDQCLALIYSTLPYINNHPSAQIRIISSLSHMLKAPFWNFSIMSYMEGKNRFYDCSTEVINNVMKNFDSCENKFKNQIHKKLHIFINEIHQYFDENESSIFPFLK